MLLERFCVPHGEVVVIPGWRGAGPLEIVCVWVQRYEAWQSNVVLLSALQPSMRLKGPGRRGQPEHPQWRSINT